MTDIGGRVARKVAGLPACGRGNVRMAFIATHKMMPYAGCGANAEYGEHSER